MARLPILIAAGMGLLCAPAFAATNPGNARTWVSGKGVDQAGCGTIASPCRTLQYAHDATASGGEIDIADGAGYGSVYITKAINIINEGAGVAGVLAPADGQAITIFAPADANVVLRGLTIEGAGVGRGGVVFLRAGSLTIANCLVQNFVGANNGAGNGIRLSPSAGATPKIFVTNTTVQNNGYVGLYYLPTSGASARLVIDRVTANNNQYGISITNSDGASTVYGYTVVVMNSTAVLNSQRGFEFIGDGDGHTVSAFMSKNVAAKNGVGIYHRNANIILNDNTSYGNLATSGASSLAREGVGGEYSYQNNVFDSVAQGNNPQSFW